jgi:2-hydroxychromene-2-carboxylate isomerase
MTEQIDVFWSFRSPYSYLATPDMLALECDYDISLHLRVVLPIALRSKKFFDPGNMNWVRYIQRDWNRRAEFLGLPHVWPNPDPIVQDLATLSVATDQPYIYRLSKLGVEAERQGRGPVFAAEVAGLLFSGTQNWDRGDHLARATERAGLDLAQMETAVADGTHMQDIEQNHAALEAAGHWGVPTFVLRGEPFFGQDRVELLRWTMDRAGIERKTQN